MTRAHWLLELEVDGRVYRWSVRDVEVERDDGETLYYRSGLVDLTAARGVSGVAVAILDEAVDWPALGRELDRRPCTLRRWKEGDAWDAAEVYALGEVTAPAWGSRKEQASWTIAESGGAELSLGVQVPDPLAVVDENTWPVLGTLIGDAGMVYPVLFGFPGYTGATDPECVVPVPLGQFVVGDYDDTVLIIAEDGTAPITEVRIHNPELGTTAYEVALAKADKLGRVVRVSDFTNDNGALPAFQTMPESEEQRRGLLAGFRPSGGGGVVRSLYDVVAYLLRRWGPGSVDWRRLPEVRDVLGAYQVDSWIDSPPGDPWEWIEAVLDDLLIDVRVGDRGRYLVPRRFLADRSRLVGAIDVDRGEAVRTSTIGLETVEVANEFAAVFRQSAAGDWIARTILTGDPTRIQASPTLAVPASTSTTVAVLASARCRLSLARYGLRQGGEQLEIDWTWDAASIARVLERRAEQVTLPARLVTLDVEDGADLREGDELELTDSEVGFDGEIAIVDAPPVVGATAASVTFRLPSES